MRLGGSVRVNGQERDIRNAGYLPNGPFRLTGINLDTTRATDADLLRLGDCKDLTYLSLLGTKASDPGVARFKDCKNLTWLSLNGTQVTDAGTAHVKDCENLIRLLLAGTKVTDAGLVHFQNRKNLKGVTGRPLHRQGPRHPVEYRSMGV